MSTSSIEQLKSNIAELKRNAQDLIAALKAEHQALQNNDIDQLQTITQSKTGLIQQLQVNYEVSLGLFKQLCYSGEPELVTPFIDQLDRGETIKQDWQSLDKLIREGQKQNEINGAVIHLSQRQLNNTLEVLYGVTKEQKTYGSSGESKPNHLPSFNIRA